MCKILQSYSGVILEDNTTFNTESVNIRVSILGRDFILSKSLSDINFEIKPDIKVRVDFVDDGKNKRIKISKAVPSKLNQEEIDILKYI